MKADSHSSRISFSDSSRNHDATLQIDAAKTETKTGYNLLQDIMISRECDSRTLERRRARTQTSLQLQFVRAADRPANPLGQWQCYTSPGENTAAKIPFKTLGQC